MQIEGMRYICDRCGIEVLRNANQTLFWMVGSQEQDNMMMNLYVVGQEVTEKIFVQIVQKNLRL